VYSHHLSAFDELIRSRLSNYPLEDFQLLLAFTSLPVMCTNLTSERILMLLSCLQVNESTLKFDESMEGLGLLSFYSDGRSDDDCFHVGQHRSHDIVLDTYYQLLFAFFNDPVRSGNRSHFYMFASAALKCLKFICQ